MLTINGGEALAIIKVVSEQNILTSLEDQADRKLLIALSRLVFATLDFESLQAPIFELVTTYKKCLVDSLSKGINF